MHKNQKNTPTTQISRRYKILWLSAMFPVLLIADILYGAMAFYALPMVVTPGTVVRGALLATAVYKIFELRKTVHYPLQIWLTFLVITIIPGFVVMEPSGSG